MTWPACSIDLTPIEHLWWHLKDDTDIALLLAEVAVLPLERRPSTRIIYGQLEIWYLRGKREKMQKKNIQQRGFPSSHTPEN